MSGAIMDGRARFGCSLDAFYKRREIAELAARAGVLIPMPADVATDAAPAFAFVNSLAPIEPVARWLCRCPDCPGGMAYVWLDRPIMLCLSCGNRGIGGTFRPVRVPARREAIEELLGRRPVERRYWEPHEDIETVRAGNAALGVE